MRWGGHLELQPGAHGSALEGVQVWYTLSSYSHQPVSLELGTKQWTSRQNSDLVNFQQGQAVSKHENEEKAYYGRDRKSYMEKKGKTGPGRLQFYNGQGKFH